MSENYKMKQIIEIANKETLKEFQEYWKPVIEKLKENFSGSESYLSGANDGMYEIIKHIALPQSDSEPKYYDMDFGGYCKARVKVTGGNVEVQMAMNGYGEAMDVGEITFEPIQ